MASFSARVRWVGVRRGDHDRWSVPTVKDAEGNGIGGAEIQISLATRRMARGSCTAPGPTRRGTQCGRSPSASCRCCGARTCRSSRSSTARRSRETGGSSRVRNSATAAPASRPWSSDATPEVGQTIRVTSLARDTSGQTRPGPSGDLDMGPREHGLCGRAPSRTRAARRTPTPRIDVEPYRRAPSRSRRTSKSYSRNRYASATFDRH